MITTIYDNLKIPTGEVRGYLRADPHDDPLIERMIDAAKRRADRYVQRDEEYFENENGEVEIPPDIELWVYKTVGRMYERRASGLSQQQIAGAENIFWEAEDMQELWPYRNLSRPPLGAEEEEE